jgi:hypothetical protein
MVDCCTSGALEHVQDLCLWVLLPYGGGRGGSLLLVPLYGLGGERVVLGVELVLLQDLQGATFDDTGTQNTQCPVGTYALPMVC